MHEMKQMHIMVLSAEEIMKKYLLIIVLLISAILVIPFMQIPTVSKILGEAVAIVTLAIIFNTVRNEKESGR